MQGIYQQLQQDKALYVDPMGMDALNRALSTRIKRLPADRMHNIDGCVTILDPPDTSDQVQPSTIVKEVEDILKSTKAMKDIFQLHILMVMKFHSKTKRWMSYAQTAVKAVEPSLMLP